MMLLTGRIAENLDVFISFQTSSSFCFWHHLLQHVKLKCSLVEDLLDDLFPHFYIFSLYVLHPVELMLKGNHQACAFIEKILYTIDGEAIKIW